MLRHTSGTLRSSSSSEFEPVHLPGTFGSVDRGFTTDKDEEAGRSPISQTSRSTYTGRRCLLVDKGTEQATEEVGRDDARNPPPFEVGPDVGRRAVTTERETKTGTKVSGGVDGEGGEPTPGDGDADKENEKGQRHQALLRRVAAIHQQLVSNREFLQGSITINPYLLLSVTTMTNAQRRAVPTNSLYQAFAYVMKSTCGRCIIVT